MAALLCAAVGFAALRPVRPPGELRPAPIPEAGAPIATEQEILGNQWEGDPAVFRLAANPEVLVLSFRRLEAQGRALNRIAALVEKAGQPRDRVLTDPELEAAIRAEGATEATYYLGHNYSIADVRRFFALARSGGVRLTPEEERLCGLLRLEDVDRGVRIGAVISISANDGPVDPEARAAILRHELSHAEYFTNPEYAAYVQRFWTEVLTEDERAAWRGHLAQAGYDPGIEDLMMDEMQAYLAHSPDPRLFDARQLGIGRERQAWLRSAFVAGMPPGWLRESTPGSRGAPLPSQRAEPTRMPRRRRSLPRSGYRLRPRRHESLQARIVLAPAGSQATDVHLALRA